VLGQGLCDLRQACGVRDSSKAVSGLGEGDACLARLAGNVFMAVQDHLGGEGRMPADLDGQMPPVRVDKVKRVNQPEWRVMTGLAQPKRAFQQ
jgi:hypothetical protein